MNSLHDVNMHTAASAAAYMCGGDDFGPAGAVADFTATLFAQAVAQASVYCEASSAAQNYANANVNAFQAAEAWLAAYTEAFANSTICNKCEYYEQSWGYVEQYVFLEAVGNASYSVRSSHLCIYPSRALEGPLDAERSLCPIAATIQRCVLEPVSSNARMGFFLICKAICHMCVLTRRFLQLSGYTEATSPRQFIGAVGEFQDTLEAAVAAAYGSALVGEISPPPFRQDPSLNSIDKLQGSVNV
jgi:hypothetical protein